MVKIAEAKINGNICEYVCDIESVEQVLLELEAFDAEEGLVLYETEDELSEAEYRAELKRFKDNFAEMITIDYAKDVLNNYPLKKNGTFYKGRIYKRVMLDACDFFQEWHNTWAYWTLTIKSISDNQIELSLQRVTDTPG